MADGEVKINTKLDTSGVDKGIKDLNKKLDDAGKSIDNAGKKSKTLNTNLGGMNKTALATAGAVAGVAVAVKKTVDALNDCEAAYKIQRNAEIALQQAAKNNPYLNNESVYNLRAFASELQSMSNIGDEVSLKVMSQLAATGRNEEQIMQIMKAAADMAAVTGEDIASAATKLNATLNGNAGMLGRQIESINNLTKEELESGRAIEIVAQQYNGSAAAMADNTVQLANAWGDFKENIGRGWSKVTAPVKQFFTDILNDMNEALGKTADLKAAEAAGAAGTETAAQAKLRLDEANAALAQMDANKGMTERRGGILAGYMVDPKWQEKRDAQAAKVEELTNRYNDLKKAEEDEAAAAQKAADEAAKAADKAAKAKSRDEQAADYINKNRQALAEQIAAMELRAKITEGDIDAQEMYNVYMQSYIDLVTKSNGLVTEGNTAAKERLALLEQWADKADKAADAKEREALAEELIKKTEGLGNTSIYDEYLAREQELLALKEQLNNAEVENEEEKAALKEQLNNAEVENEEEKAARILAIEEEKAARILAIDEELVKNRRKLWADIASEVTGYASQVNDIIQEATQLALDAENKRMNAELANLELLYRKGVLSEEEYQRKVAEAKRKGAETQYQIEMAQWASNILMATANTAVGVTQALAQGGVAGIITGALVGAAGAVQLASIIAAKPQKHFAAGGVVGGMNGATMGADNTTIAARNGEMIMNANQQRALWDMLNGVGTPAKAGGYNLIINNSAANLVSAQPQLSRGQIEIMIDARVNDGLKNGRFNSGLNAANASMGGTFYGS